MIDQVVTLANRIRENEFRERWEAMGYKTRPQIAAEVGVSPDAVKRWEDGSRPVPRYAWRALERVEASKRRR